VRAYGLKLHERERALLLKAVAVSAGIHIMLIGSAGVASLFQKKPEWKDLSIQVTLLGPPRGGKEAAGPSAPSHNLPEQKQNLSLSPPPAPEEKPKIIKKPELEKRPEKELKKAWQKNVKTKENKKNQKDITKEKKKNEKSPKKPEKNRKQEPDLKKPVELAAHAGQSAGQETTGRTSDDAARGKGSETGFGKAMQGIEGDLRMMYYREEAAAKLFEAWSPPMSVPVDQGLHFDVMVRVDASGKVIDYKVLYESGNADLDRSVMTLLEDIKRLPPPPYTPESGVQELPFRFVPEDEEWR